MSAPDIPPWDLSPLFAKPQPDGGWVQGEVSLWCPACGFGYTHLTAGRRVTKRADWYLLNNGDEAFILTGYCENGHDFEIAFSQYKGHTFLGVRTKNSEPYP